MDTIAILLPTIGRSERLDAVVKNIHETTTTPHKIYLICERFDLESIKKASLLHEECMEVNTNGYVAAINVGYRSSTEPFVFCGSDDIVFEPEWDIKMLKVFEDKAIGIVGAKDEWTISKTGKHASHFMVRREYIVKQSGVMDERNVIYSSAYIHIMCDIETEQTAMKRGAFAMSDAFISHKHWFMGTAKKDATYQRAMDAQHHDMTSYNARRNKFELFKFEDLFRGLVTPVRKGGLTVVIPSYNEKFYLQQTVESLAENTYNKYELIIIDDLSNQETVDYIKSLDCIKVFNEKQEYVNANWNKGIAMANNEYVCVANNDITFSRHWDLPLMDQLHNEDVWIASPYQTDPAYPIPYGKHERSGNIDLRGSCFMLKKRMIEQVGFIPRDLIIWFGDYWLTVQAQKHGKRCIFSDKSVIHHYGSKSSIDMMQDRKKLFFQILRGDAYAFKAMTEINVDHWLQIIYENLELPSPV